MSLTDAEPNVLHPYEEDAVFLRYDADLESQFDIPKQLKGHFEAQGPYYLVIDLSKSPRLMTNASDEGPSVVDAAWFRGVVFVNASGLMKMGLKVFHLGMYLVGQKDFPSVFVKTLDEASGGLAELRVKSASKKA